MNERIKELWDQAAKLEPDPSWAGQTKFMEKFALLIVRECSNIACQYDEPKMSGPGMIIAGRIESHFGVEQ